MRGSTGVGVGFVAAASLGCGIFHDGRPDDTSSNGDDAMALISCDITCQTDGLDLQIEASGATSASVEFYVSGDLVETFDLDDLDDRTWVAYPDWPSGTSFADCGSEADFVCIVSDGTTEIREAQ